MKKVDDKDSAHGFAKDDPILKTAIFKKTRGLKKVSRWEFFWFNKEFEWEEFFLDSNNQQALDYYQRLCIYYLSWTVFIVKSIFQFFFRFFFYLVSSFYFLLVNPRLLGWILVLFGLYSMFLYVLWPLFLRSSYFKRNKIYFVKFFKKFQVFSDVQHEHLEFFLDYRYYATRDKFFLLMVDFLSYVFIFSLIYGGAFVFFGYSIRWWIIIYFLF